MSIEYDDNGVPARFYPSTAPWTRCADCGEQYPASCYQQGHNCPQACGRREREIYERAMRGEW